MGIDYRQSWRRRLAILTLCASALAMALPQGIGFLKTVSEPQTPAADPDVQILIVHTSPQTGKKTTVYRRVGSSAVIYFSGMTIDADGAPNAYHPTERRGLDSLNHAGANGRWWALVLDEHKRPVVQKSGLFKGFYVSQTWLSREDDLYPETDPRYWVDARTVPYIAVPKSVWKRAGIEKGDLAYVVNEITGRASAAIVADWGTEETLGEGSISLGDALGFESSSPRTGGQDSGIDCIVFPRTAANPRWPRDVAEMAVKAQQLFQEWGGEAALDQIRRKTSK